MLIEFRVKNFRSLRDEQVLSMVASSDKELRDTHVVETGLKAAPGLLKAAAIYGANASGKSTVIRALQVMRQVVIGSASRFRPGQSLPGQTFRLDARSVSEPIEFEERMPPSAISGTPVPLRASATLWMAVSCGTLQLFIGNRTILLVGYLKSRADILPPLLV